MKKLISIVLLGLGLFSCENDEQNNQTDSVISKENTVVNEIDSNHLSTENNTENSDHYTVTAIYTDSIGWGYQILNNEQPFINQPHIPAISGVKGFASEDDAIKTGNFAIYKIENGVFPPTISEEELDSLGVLK
ncbi:MAG: DUF4907 domain-containing protein [Crocinitomicaceae bacterium]|nr:DUF4907 domain-containing protein [Crocinitomicaceae bacterium]